MINKPDFTEADVIAIREAATALAQIAKATNLPKDISAELAQLNSIADRLDVLITPSAGDNSQPPHSIKSESIGDLKPEPWPDGNERSSEEIDNTAYGIWKFGADFR